MQPRHATIPGCALLLAAALAGCGSSGSGSQAQPDHSSPRPSPSASPAASSAASGGSSYPSLAALEAALSRRAPCLSPQTASTAGIAGAVATAVCYGGFHGQMTQPDARLILFDSHADAAAWQAARAAGNWDGYYIIGGNWAVAGPAVYGLYVDRVLGGTGVSPTASPGISTDAPPP